MSKIKIKPIEIIYILLMVISFQGNNLFQVIIGFIIIFISLFSNQKLQLYKFDCQNMIKWFFLPSLLIHIYTIILIIFSKTDSSILTTNFLTYLPILISISIVRLLGMRGCIDTFIALLIAWTIKLIKIIYINGISSIIVTINQIFIQRVFSRNIFEMDDIVLASGYFFVLFLALKITNKKISLVLGYSLVFIFILGMKRVGLLAVIITFMVYLLTCKLSIKKKYKVCKIISFLIVVFGVAFIYLISDKSFLSLFLNKYSINVMSRDYFWNYIINKTKFKLSFIGMGRGSVKQLMYNQFYPYQNVHSDYIKMFAELGFIPYLMWLFYYFYLVTKKIKRTYGIESAYVYLLTVVYTAILFITDNTESYYICGIMRCIIPIAYISYIKNDYIKIKNCLNDGEVL